MRNVFSLLFAVFCLHPAFATASDDFILHKIRWGMTVEDSLRAMDDTGYFSKLSVSFRAFNDPNIANITYWVFDDRQKPFSLMRLEFYFSVSYDNEKPTTSLYAIVVPILLPFSSEEAQLFGRLIDLPPKGCEYPANCFNQVDAWLTQRYGEPFFVSSTGLHKRWRAPNFFVRIGVQLKETYEKSLEDGSGPPWEGAGAIEGNAIHFIYSAQENVRLP